MTDSEFLTWIHARLVNHHGENPNYDYMHRLREVAERLAKPIHPAVAAFAEIDDDTLDEVFALRPDLRRRLEAIARRATA